MVLGFWGHRINDFVFWGIGMRFLLFLMLFMGLKVSANYLGADVQTFHPVGSQLDLFTVQSGRTLKAKWWAVSIFGSYSQNNLLIYKAPLDKQVIQKSSDSLLAMQMNLSFGFTEHLEWGIAFPAYLKHTVADDQVRKLYVQDGFISVRNHLKYSFTDFQGSSGAAAILSVDLPNVYNDPYVGKVANPILIAELAYDTRTPKSLFAVNLGGKFRQPSQVVDNATMYPLGNEFLFSLGWTGSTSEKSAMNFVTELVGSTPIGSAKYKYPRDVSSLEVLLGIRGLMAQQRSWSLGLGIEALPGSMSPDWRVYGGWAWQWTDKRRKYRDIIVEQKGKDSFYNKDNKYSEMSSSGGEDSDHDGIEDDKDECPRTPSRIAVDALGCPFDSDNDGIFDYEDQCSKTPQGDIVDKFGCTVRY
jgi:hypothetical protein